MSVLIKRYIFYFVCYLMISCSFSIAENTTAEKIKSCSSVPGDAYKACVVAYNDYTKFVENEYNGIKEYSESNLYFMNMDNYSAEVTEHKNFYIVYFSFNGHILGGDAEYKVSKRRYKIISKKYYE